MNLWQRRIKAPAGQQPEGDSFRQNTNSDEFFAIRTPNLSVSFISMAEAERSNTGKLALTNSLPIELRAHKEI